MSLYRGPSIIGESADNTVAMVLSAISSATNAANAAAAANTSEVNAQSSEEAAAASALALATYEGLTSADSAAAEASKVIAVNAALAASNSAADAEGSASSAAASENTAATKAVEVVTIASNIGLVQSAVTAATLGGATATSQAALATVAKTAAEAARDAAMVAGKVYATTAEGLAATTTTQYFSVPSPDSAESLILYLNNAGAAVEQKRYPSAAFVASATPLGAAWSVQDGAGSAAIEVLDDGTFRVAKLLADVQAVGNASFEDVATPGYVWTVRDEAGNVAAGITDDGKLVATLKEAPGATVPLVERYGGVYASQVVLLITAGQSNAQGNGAAVTTAQEYDNIGFPASTPSPGTAYPLTVANTAYGGLNMESPMYGTSGYIKELIAKEQGLLHTVNDYQLLACNDGSSGAPIDEIRKGGSRGAFEKGISQVQSGKAMAASSGKTFSFGMVTWTQGESDGAMAKDTYKAKLKQLALDYNTDGKAVTGQGQDVLFVTYQLSSFPAKDTVAVAQLEASEEVTYIKLATPIYFMEFMDVSVHLDGVSLKWLGGYYGLVCKRVLVDRKDWQPLKPVQHTVLGNTLDLYFNKEGLVFDTTGMPAQVNQGFTVFDGAAAAVAISSIAIIKPNRVRLTFATPPQAGWTVKYGHINVVGKTNYNGAGGNLRDSAGDQLVYASINKPMHNWSVIFSRPL